MPNAFTSAILIVPLTILMLTLKRNLSVLRPAILGLTSAPLVFNEQLNVSYRSRYQDGVENFYNIFYAEDTSSFNRFRAPVPYVPAPGTILDATAPGAFCAQGMGSAAFPFTSPVNNISENCLSLRVSRPYGTNADSKLPVLVWIHGGGSALGSAYDQLYNPAGLILQASRNKQPVIFVAMNYRLGIFGFATNQALRQEKQGNAGLRDQGMAFQWVKDNIQAFGGDPDRVTAIGQSVGASAIAMHLTSYRGERGVPFQKAIMMSGASGLNFNVDSDLVANNTAQVAESLGCIKGSFDSTGTMDCLRDVPMEKLMNVSVTLSRQSRPPFGELSFYPSLDGDYVAERPSLLMRSGQFVKGIPIIASWVTNDGAWYALPTTDDDQAVLASLSTFVVNFSRYSLQRFLDLYPVTDFEHMVPKDSPLTAQYYRAAQINRDVWFTCPVIDFTWQYARQGSSSVRLYEMNQTKFGPVFDKLGLGFWRVSHLSGIPFVMNGKIAGGDNSIRQRKLSALVSGSVAAFAYSSDPTVSSGKVLQAWPLAYDSNDLDARTKEHPGNLTLLVIGGPHGSGPAVLSRETDVDDSARVQAVQWERLLERCEFINSITEEIGV